MRIFNNFLAVIFIWLCLLNALRADDGFVAEGITLRTPIFQNTLAANDIFSRSGSASVLYVRGVLLQGISRFADIDGRKIEASRVRIGWNYGRLASSWNWILSFFTEVENNRICLFLDHSDCLQFGFSDENLVSIAKFVDKNRVLAFTLAANARDKSGAWQAAEANGLVPVTVARRKSQIASELDTLFFAELLAFIDFDISRDPRYNFPDKGRDQQLAENIRKSLNKELGYEQRPSTNEYDGSWINTDLHAKFVVTPSTEDATRMSCEGLPARYKWTLFEGSENAFVDKVWFAGKGDKFTKVNRFRRDALALFCTTAIMRALKIEDADAFSEILDSAIAP